MAKREKAAKAEALYYGVSKALGEIWPSAWYHDGAPGRAMFFKHFFEGLGLSDQFRVVRMLIVDPRKFTVVPKPRPRAKARKAKGNTHCACGQRWTDHNMLRCNPPAKAKGGKR